MIIKKNKKMVTGREGVAPEVENQMNGETMIVVTLIYFSRWFRGGGSPHEDVKLIAGDKLKTFGMMRVCIVRIVSLGVKMESYE